MEKIVIVITSLMYNRGSEAILRSLVLNCRGARPDSKICVVTGEAGEVIKTVEGADEVVPRIDEKGNYRYLIDEIKDADYVLITGADNYDAPKGNPMITFVNDLILNHTEAKTVFYDCSLYKDHLIESTKCDLNRFDILTTRESITYELFKENFPNVNVRMFPDPAFNLPSVKCEMPWGFENGNMIGINISNLILTGKYGASKDMILYEYRNLIEYILSNTDYKIVLVQHILNNGFDWDAISELYKGYEYNERVLRMKTEHLDCMQIKYIISKLEFLVTARTHAAIAAYSSCVPVLAVSYSVKSLGIAKDIWGDNNNCLVQLSEMKNGYELVETFEYMAKNGEELRQHLNAVIPDMKKQAKSFGEKVLK